MLRLAPQTAPLSEPEIQARFLEFLPLIERHARIACRYLRGSEREERVAEVIALAFSMFRRLAERRLLDAAYPTPLARYAIRQARSGRRVGRKLNAHDVTSIHCQRITGVQVESLQQLDIADGEWKEVLNDKRASPAEIVACRLDFSAWLGLLSAPLRRIAKTLAIGEVTSAAARQHGVSAGRISQIRRELKESWDRFQAEPAEQLAVASG